MNIYYNVHKTLLSIPSEILIFFSIVYFATIKLLFPILTDIFYARVEMPAYIFHQWKLGHMFKIHANALDSPNSLKLLDQSLVQKLS